MLVLEDLFSHWGPLLPFPERVWKWEDLGDLSLFLSEIPLSLTYLLLLTLRLEFSFLAIFKKPNYEVIVAFALPADLAKFLGC